MKISYQDLLMTADTVVSQCARLTNVRNQSEFRTALASYRNSRRLCRQFASVQCWLFGPNTISHSCRDSSPGAANVPSTGNNALPRSLPSTRQPAARASGASSVNLTNLAELPPLGSVEGTYGTSPDSGRRSS